MDKLEFVPLIYGQMTPLARMRSQIFNQAVEDRGSALDPNPESISKRI